MNARNWPTANPAWARACPAPDMPTHPVGVAAPHGRPVPGSNRPAPPKSSPGRRALLWTVGFLAVLLTSVTVVLIIVLIRPDNTQTQPPQPPPATSQSVTAPAEPGPTDPISPRKPLHGKPGKSHAAPPTTSDGNPVNNRQ